MNALKAMGTTARPNHVGMGEKMPATQPKLAMISRKATSQQTKNTTNNANYRAFRDA